MKPNNKMLKWKCRARTCLSSCHKGPFKVVTRHTLERAVVVAQLVERSLPTLEIRGLSPVIGTIFLLASTVLKSFVEKTNIKRKEARKDTI